MRNLPAQPVAFKKLDCIGIRLMPNGGPQTRKCMETKIELTKQVSCKTPTKSQACINDDLTLSLLNISSRKDNKNNCQNPLQK